MKNKDKQKPVGVGMKEWIPLITKLVWPIFIIFALIIFNDEVSNVYGLILERIKAGGSVEIGGFFRLGEKATNTKISDLSPDNLSIEAIGGAAGVVRKGSRSALRQLQEELANSPTKTLNTLLLPDDIRFFSVKLIKEYVSTLNLQYVVFQEGGKFAGWMTSGSFIAQLPEDPQQDILNYDDLKNMVGINQNFVLPGISARKVLEKLQELHIDSIPVVDQEGRWLFFANRGEILSQLMTSLILSAENE
ncbi:MAG: hypothetical protein Kow0042_29090 [Calditrichia bacterium]